MDSSGALLASASGSAPSWVRSVPGAEAWALLQAALAFGDAPAYRVDCLSVVQLYAKGFKKASAANSLFADTWAQIEAWDSTESVDLAWMPSHTAFGDIGACTLINDMLLTAIDRDANAIADDLAKSAALQHRVPEACRNAIDAEVERALPTLAGLG